MNRRSFMELTAGCAALAASPGVAAAAARDPMRPGADIMPAGAGRWRVRSWTRAGDAWRPLIAYAADSPAPVSIVGPIDPADRAWVERWIAERHG